MSEVIRDVMYNVGDSINGGEEMSIVVPLINEFIVKRFDIIIGLKGIKYDNRLQMKTFIFYVSDYIMSRYNFDDFLEVLRDELVSIYKMVGLYDRKSLLFYTAGFDYTYLN